MPSSKHILDLREMQEKKKQRLDSADVLFKVSKTREQADYDFDKKTDHQTPQGFFYNTISGFGWLIEKIILGILLILKVVKTIIFSPIKFLDLLLDEIVKLIGSLIKFIFKLIVKGFKFFYQRVKTIEIRLPYFWYKRVGVFLILALALILPIKIFFEVPNLISAQQKILGFSTRTIGYYSFFNELKDYLPAAQVVKEFSGFNGPRRYLLVFQNNAELRATGGFMGSYALVDVKDGEIVNMDIPSGGFYDLKGYSIAQVEAPLPFHIFSPYWQTWNANWFADFPTSAKKLIHFYEISGGPTVDGVIALTPNLVEDLLLLTGPIELAEYDTVIDNENFRRQTQIEVEFEYNKEDNTPKAFIGGLVPILLDRVFSLAEANKTEALLQALDQALQEKHLLFYSTNEEINNLLKELNWSGNIREAWQDYLQIVHTNIGGGKTDLVIQDQINQTIKFEADGSVISEIKLSRSHNGDPEDLFEGHDNLDYIRFYVPNGAKLIKAKGFLEDDLSERFKTAEEELVQDPDLAESRYNSLIDLQSGTEIFQESGKTVFANWLSLKPGQIKIVKISYRLPNKIDFLKPYYIYWQKQSGTQGAPLQVRIKLPEDKQFVNWLPQNSHINLISDNELIFSNDLRVDRYLSFSIK